MSIIKKMRKQTAVLWVRGATPDQFGKYTFADPVEIACRWEGAGKEYLGPQGQVEVSESVAYVDRELKYGDRLRLGGLESTDTNDPTSDSDAVEVRRFEKTPNFRATENLYIAYLSLRYA